MATFANLGTIANDFYFQQRCLYAAYVAAINVMAESGGTAHHAQRVSYATQILTNSASSTSIALGVLTNSTISGEADITQPSPGYAIPDGDIQFTVNSIFNSLAGIPAN